MHEEAKGKSKVRRIAVALAFLIPMISILVAEATGWDVMSIYLAVDAIYYAFLGVLIVLALVLLLPLLWSHIRSRFF